MNKATKASVVTAVWAILVSVSGIGSDIRAASESMLDDLESKLEMRRHEELAAIKRKPDNSPAPFTTDGCSGGLSIGWRYLSEHIDHIKEIHGDLPPWESCCITHDRAYHTGGTRQSTPEESFTARRSADEQLRRCVIDTAAGRARELSEAYGLSPGDVQRIYTVIGSLMYRAVRLGGMPCSGLPWRWGYGWPECE